MSYFNFHMSNVKIGVVKKPCSYDAKSSTFQLPPTLRKRTAGMERMEIEVLSVKDSANAISFFCQTKFNLPKKTIQMMAISA